MKIGRLGKIGGKGGFFLLLAFPLPLSHMHIYFLSSTSHLHAGYAGASGELGVGGGKVRAQCGTGSSGACGGDGRGMRYREQT